MNNNRNAINKGLWAEEFKMRVNSKAVGNYFEGLIKAQCLYYKTEYSFKIKGEDISEIQINKEEGQTTKKGGYREKLHVDFMGYTTRYNKEKLKTAVPIAFECKTTNQTFMSLSRLKEHQLKYLTDLFYNGGIAFLLIEFRRYNEVIKIIVDDYFLDNILVDDSIHYNKLMKYNYRRYDIFNIDFLDLDKQSRSKNKEEQNDKQK